MDEKRNEPVKKTIDDLGPTLPRLRWWKKIWHVLIYAIGHQKLRIGIMTVFILLVALGASFWSELQLPSGSQDTPEGIIEWLLNAQTILGMGTLLVALFVWIGEIEKNWEEEPAKAAQRLFLLGGKAPDRLPLCLAGRSR